MQLLEKNQKITATWFWNKMSTQFAIHNSQFAITNYPNGSLEPTHFYSKSQILTG